MSGARWKRAVPGAVPKVLLDGLGPEVTRFGPLRDEFTLLRNKPPATIRSKHSSLTNLAHQISAVALAALFPAGCVRYPWFLAPLRREMVGARGPLPGLCSRLSSRAHR